MMAVAALGCMTAMPLPAWAQEPTVVAGVSAQAAGTGVRTVMGAVETRITPDRPYSAEAVNESLQLLPDGNRIHRTTLTKVYRDSAGRTRREMFNAQELKIISEQWFSDELQVLVMTKHNDPRSGESIYRLRNVLRGEPDPSLFMVPGDYTLQERR